MRSRSLFGLLLTAWLVCCKGETPRTELVLRIENRDLPVCAGQGLRAVRVSITHYEGATNWRSERAFEICDGGAGLLDGSVVALPIHVGLLPAQSDSLRAVFVEVVGCTDALCRAELVRQHAIVSFSPGETLLVPVILSRSCSGLTPEGASLLRTCRSRDVTCNPDTQQCVSARRDSRTLPRLVALDPVDRDATVVPRELDAAPADASKPEAATEDGPVDAVDAAPPLDGDARDADSAVVVDATGEDVAPDGGPPDAPVVDVVEDASVDAATRDVTGLDVRDAEDVTPDTGARPDVVQDAGSPADVDPCMGLCAAGQTCCAGRCVSTATDGMNCGACGRACALAHATAGCAAGACVVTRCDAGFSNCDGVASNGCEADFSSDANNCGMCRNVCPNVLRGLPGCRAGACGVGACDTNFGDCDGVASNGCETDLRAAGTHCGVCGNRCAAACVGGRCVAATGLSSGYLSTCARLANDTARCWGDNTSGQLGISSTTSVNTATASVVTTAAVAQVEVGSSHGCLVSSAGGVSCWGSNNLGVVGAPSTVGVAPTPLEVSALSGVVQVSAGEGVTCARTASEVWCWGTSPTNGGAVQTHTPQRIAGISTVAQLATGRMSSCAIVAGEVWCWGENGYGNLGNGLCAMNTPTPVRALGLTGITQMSSEGDHACAVRNDGAVFCWGYGMFGQLGDGGTANRCAPVRVTTSRGAVQVAAGSQHTCAVLNDGTVECWGRNRAGQLGNGVTTDQSTPVAVRGITGAVEVTAGGEHSCARLSDGGVRCWGDGMWGQLGNGVMTRSLTPVSPAW